MKTTMKDIAKECNVTPSTVSLTLSGKKNRVSEEKRKLILEAAQRLNYIPNKAAVSLVTSRSRMIGAVVADLRNTHISSMFMSINEYLQENNYRFLCHVVNDGNSEDSYNAVKEMLGAGVDGIFFAPPALNGRQHNMLKSILDQAGIPVVCNADFGLACSGADVCLNYEQGGYIATKNLIECGHRTIGCVTGPPEFVVTIERLKGYQQALAEAGIEFRQQLVYQGDYSVASGKEALAYLLGQKVTAIFAFNDDMAFGLYQSARLYNVKIPGDVSIMGFDNVPFSDVLEVPLSTINVPMTEMSKIIATELIDRIEDKTDGKRTRYFFEPDLIVRGSVQKLKS